MTGAPAKSLIRLPLLLLAAALQTGYGSAHANPDAPAPDVEKAPVERDGSRDFDFEFGKWTAHISRRMNALSGSDEWVEYEGPSVVRKVWNGRANLGEINVEGPAGTIQGLSLRLYNPETRQWHISWASSRDGMIGEPMVGEFRDGIGEFYNQETFNGRSIFVRFIFSEIRQNSFRLEQAFSDDGGKTWEANWIATFERQ